MDALALFAVGCYQMESGDDRAAPVDVSAELALAVNAAVMRGLGPTGFRTRPAGSRGSGVVYDPPATIERSLARLLAATSSERQRLRRDARASLLDHAILAAVFYVKFLRIHPFANGNGRTARILFAVLLRDWSAAALPLHATFANNQAPLARRRSDYIDAIRAGDAGAEGWCRYVVDCLANHLSYTLD